MKSEQKTWKKWILKVGQDLPSHLPALHIDPRNICEMFDQNPSNNLWGNGCKKIMWRRRLSRHHKHIQLFTLWELIITGILFRLQLIWEYWYLYNSHFVLNSKYYVLVYLLCTKYTYTYMYIKNVHDCIIGTCMS